MKSYSNHSNSTIIIIGIFFSATILVSLLVENQIHYFIVLAIATTGGLFRIYSGKKVNDIFLNKTTIEVSPLFVD